MKRRAFFQNLVGSFAVLVGIYSTPITRFVRSGIPVVNPAWESAPFYEAFFFSDGRAENIPTGRRWILKDGEREEVPMFLIS